MESASSSLVTALEPGTIGGIMGVEFECTVQDFLGLDKSVQDRARMFQPEIVHFPSASSTASTMSLEQRLQNRSTMGVARASWMIGMWIARGSKYCRITGVPQIDMSDVAVHVSKREALIAALDGWTISSSPSSMLFNLNSTFASILASYSLWDFASVVTIPPALLTDSVLVRRSLLGGLLAGFVSIPSSANTFVVDNVPSTLVSSLAGLARSLGCVPGAIVEHVAEFNIIISETQMMHSMMSTATIMGENAAHIKSTTASHDASLSHSFRIIPVGVGEFFGFAVSGNGRLLLSDYTVTHNSLDSLLEKFGGFSEKVIRSYTKQLLEALAYCHANRVVHRDIKGKNILINTSGQLKLAGFGSAKRFTNVMSKDAPSLSYNYTPLWTAPEVLVGN